MAFSYLSPNNDFFLLNDTGPNLLNFRQGSFIITMFVLSSQLRQERRKASHVLGMFEKP